MKAATEAAVKRLMELDPADLAEQVAQGQVKLEFQFKLDDDEADND